MPAKVRLIHRYLHAKLQLTDALSIHGPPSITAPPYDHQPSSIGQADPSLRLAGIASNISNSSYVNLQASLHPGGPGMMSAHNTMMHPTGPDMMQQPNQMMQPQPGPSQIIMSPYSSYSGNSATLMRPMLLPDQVQQMPNQTHISPPTSPMYSAPVKVPLEDTIYQKFLKIMPAAKATHPPPGIPVELFLIPFDLHSAYNGDWWMRENQIQVQPITKAWRSAANDLDLRGFDLAKVRDKQNSIVSQRDEEHVQSSPPRPKYQLPPVKSSSPRSASDFDKLDRDIAKDTVRDISRDRDTRRSVRDDDRVSNDRWVGSNGRSYPHDRSDTINRDTGWDNARHDDYDGRRESIRDKYNSNASSRSDGRYNEPTSNKRRRDSYDEFDRRDVYRDDDYRYKNDSRRDSRDVHRDSRDVHRDSIRREYDDQDSRDRRYSRTRESDAEYRDSDARRHRVRDHYDDRDHRDRGYYGARDSREYDRREGRRDDGRDDYVASPPSHSRNSQSSREHTNRHDENSCSNTTKEDSERRKTGGQYAANGEVAVYWS